MRRFFAGLLILVSALCLVLASTSLWLRQNVIDSEVFIGNVEAMADLPEVEARITERVTATVMSNPQVQDVIDEAVAVLPERLQQFEPTVENGVRSLIAVGVQRLLTSDPFRPLTRAALTSAHGQLVDGEAVEFTLGMAKERVPESLQDGLAGQVLELLPDDVGVTILTPADAPQIYSAIDLLRSAWWWLGLVALGALAGALGVSHHRRGTLRAWAVTTTVLTLLVLVALRVTRGLLLPQVRAENRDAVGAMYDVLAGSLRAWTLWLLAVALLVLVVALVWGRLGLVAGVRRGITSARTQLTLRRDEARAARAVGADGTATAGADSTPVAEESWTRRVAVWWRAFADGFDLPERTASLGARVRDHRDPARWAGIAVGALVLLFWPAPTLSVLIWIVALSALYLGALAWLEDRAPERAADAGGAVAVGAAPVLQPGDGSVRGAGNGVPLTSASGRHDRVEHAPPTGLAGAPTGDGTAEPVATAVDARSTVVPEPRGAVEPLIPAALTPETLSTMSGRLDLLVRLGAARDAGVLTDDEFDREKGRLLGV